MQISARKLCLISITLLYIPNLLFMFGWLKIYYAATLCIFGGIILYRLICDVSLFEEIPPLIIEKKALILLFIGLLIIVWLSGIGGFFPQTYDSIIRNPIFRDLIIKPWPVFYEELNASLCYYFAFWLIPALIGKLLLAFGLSSNLVWEISNVLLLLESALYLLMTFLIILSYTKQNVRCKNVLKLLFCFISFGGISVIGYKLTQATGIYHAPMTFDGLLIEIYSHIGRLNNFFLMLSSVFNQMLPALLCVAIYFITRKTKIFGYLLSLILLAAPYPAVGLLVIMIADCITSLVRQKKLLLKEYFSCYNVFGIIWLVVIYLFYFNNTTAGITLNRFWLNYDTVPQLLIALIIYHFCMWMCYYIFSYSASREKKMLNIIFVCLLLFIFGIGDFNMRASIPPMFILFINVYQQIEYNSRNKMYLTSLLTLSFVTPVFLLGTLAGEIVPQGTMIQRIDPFYTLGSLQESDLNILPQYIVYDPNQSIFVNTIGKAINSFDTYPNIEYAIGADGKRYIKRASLMTPNARELFLEDVSSSSQEYVQNILQQFPDETFFEFDSETVLCAERSFLDADAEGTVEITWENYMKKIYSNKTALTLSLLIKNTGSDKISVGQQTEGNDSGVVVSLCDAEKNVLVDIWSYQYTNKTIYPGDTRQMILNIPRPEATGTYYFKFDYFCDGADGISHRNYAIPSYYLINVP